MLLGETNRSTSDVRQCSVGKSLPLWQRYWWGLPEDAPQPPKTVTSQTENPAELEKRPLKCSRWLPEFVIGPSAFNPCHWSRLSPCVHVCPGGRSMFACVIQILANNQETRRPDQTCHLSYPSLKAPFLKMTLWYLEDRWCFYCTHPTFKGISPWRRSWKHVFLHVPFVSFSSAQLTDETGVFF